MEDERYEVSDEDLLAEIMMYPDPVVTATELTGRFDITREAINKRLNGFRGEGYVASKKVGAAARVWWITQYGREYLDNLRQSDGQ